VIQVSWQDLGKCLRKNLLVHSHCCGLLKFVVERNELEKIGKPNKGSHGVTVRSHRIDEIRRFLRDEWRSSFASPVHESVHETVSGFRKRWFVALCFANDLGKVLAEKNGDVTKEKDSYFLPTLDEYARPFVSSGFEILRKDTFCWVPHSVGQSMTTMLRFMSPLLNGIGRRYARKCLVISRKTDRRHP